MPARCETVTLPVDSADELTRQGAVCAGVMADRRANLQESGMALRPSRRLSAALSGLQEYCSCSWTDLGVMDKTASLRGARAPLADRMTRRIAIHGPVFWSGMLAGRLREVGFRATGFSSGGGHLGGQVRFLWWFLRASRRLML